MMQLDVVGLRNNDPVAMKQLLADCRACALRVSGKVGAQSFADDIAQDMAMVVLTSFLNHYEPGREVQPFLCEMARRMGLKYYNRHSREYLQGDDNFDVEAEDDETNVELQNQRDADEARSVSARSALMEQMARAKAQAEIAASSPPPVLPDRPRELDRPVRSAAREAVIQQQRERAARPEVVELSRIRNELGYTQIEMSRALGMDSDNKVRTIEYGVIYGDMDVLLEQARELLSIHRGELSATAPVSQHITRWMKKLDLEPDDFDGLSRMIGVHRTTLYRWRNGKTQPAPRVIRQMDAIVDEFVAFEMRGR